MTIAALRRLPAVVLIILGACTSSPPDGTLAELAEPFGEGTVTLSGGDHTVTLDVYVADTNALRRQGLMGWESLPAETGMLFTYDEDSDGGFWMKNTLIPLSIAFADADGTIHTILDMEPCEADPCPLYEADRPYRHALEVEQGAFDTHGVEPGWRLQFEPAPTQARLGASPTG